MDGQLEGDDDKKKKELKQMTNNASAPAPKVGFDFLQLKQAEVEQSNIATETDVDG